MDPLQKQIITIKLRDINDDLHRLIRDNYMYTDKITVNNKFKEVLFSLREKEFLINLDLSYINIGELEDKTIINLICDEIINNHNCNLVELNLSNNEFEHDDLMLIGKSLKNNTTLTSLTLNENIYYYGEDEDYEADVNRISYNELTCILNSLYFNTTLTNLSLEFNGLTDDEIKLISSFLINNNTITKLNLSKNIITDKGIEHLSKALTINTTLSSLILSNCFINYSIEKNRPDDYLMDNLLECSKNTNFNLLCNVLKNNTSLTELDLSYNSLGSNGLILLSEVLNVNTSLITLNLGNTNFKTGSDGFKSLCETLKTNSTLTKLNLFGDASYYWSLYDDSNQKIKNQDCKILSEALKINTSLTYIDLHDISFDSEGLKYICDALTINSTLTFLNISNHDIHNETNITIINEMLKHNTTLTKLIVNGNEDDVYQLPNFI